MRIYAVFCILIVLSSFSKAEVDPISGELTFEMVDLTTKEALTPFKLQREYNHKRQSFGLLGNAWCTQLEEFVVRTSEGLEITKCGQPTKSVFTKIDGAYVNKPGTEIMKELPNSSGFMRIGNEYIFGYNAQGYLALIARKGNLERPHIRIVYNKKNLIQKIIHRGKNQYDFSYDVSNKTLVKISGPKGIQVNYSYDKNLNLVTVKNVWGKNLIYSYDSKNRINSFTLPDNKKYKVIFDQNLDVVTKVLDSKNCGDSFDYTMDVGAGTIKTVVKNSCLNKSQVFSSTSSSLFHKNRLSRNSLYRIPASINRNILDGGKGWKSFKGDGMNWEYHENAIGNITQIKATDLKSKNQQLIQAKYLDQRLVELSLNGDHKITFKYNKGKLDAMESAKNNELQYSAFELFTRFLLAKSEAK